MSTKLFPTVKIDDHTWEIDEFDNASIFLLEGTEKALLIDCGIGIGDLKGYVEMLTDKPLIVVISHGHHDHIGNLRQFDEIWINPRDLPRLDINTHRARSYVENIAARQKGCFGAPYTMFNLYPFDINEDLHGYTPEDKPNIIHDLLDGQQFDLGGGRVITAYECPGHSLGEMVFLDDSTRSLFCGDAINFNLGLSAEPVEKSLRYLKRIQAMGDRYDKIYNSHHDFRPLGAPLDDDCLPNAISVLEDVIAGNYMEAYFPPLNGGNNIPLTPWTGSMPINPNVPKQVYVHKGRSYIGFDNNNIFENK